MIKIETGSPPYAPFDGLRNLYRASKCTGFLYGILLESVGVGVHSIKRGSANLTRRPDEKRERGVKRRDRERGAVRGVVERVCKRERECSCDNIRVPTAGSGFRSLLEFRNVKNVMSGQTGGPQYELI